MKDLTIAQRQQIVSDLEALYQMGKPGYVTVLSGTMTVFDAATETITKIIGQFHIAFTCNSHDTVHNGVTSRMCEFLLLQIQEIGVTYRGMPDNPCLPLSAFIGRLGNVMVDNTGKLAFYI